MVTIDTTGSGAVMEGTEKWMRDTIKAGSRSWRWSRNLDAWFLPRSLLTKTVDAHVARTVEVLQDAGITVEVIDEGRDDEDTRARHRLDRDEELVQVHKAKAQRWAARAEAAHKAEHQILDMIPPGQPILVGHYSERRHRKALEKADRLMHQAIEAYDMTKAEDHKASSAAGRAARRQWKAQGGKYGPEDIQPGDMLLTRHRWWVKAVRVNRKTITFEAPDWYTDPRVPYIDIYEVSKTPEDFELHRPDLCHYRPRQTGQQQTDTCEDGG